MEEKKLQKRGGWIGWALLHAGQGMRAILPYVAAVGVGGLLLEDAMTRWWWLKPIFLVLIWLAVADHFSGRGALAKWREKSPLAVTFLILFVAVPVLLGGISLYKQDSDIEPSYLHIHPPELNEQYSYFGPGHQLGFNVNVDMNGPGKLKNVLLLARMYIVEVGPNSEARARSLYEREIEAQRKRYLSGREPEGPEMVNNDVLSFGAWTPKLSDYLCERIKRQTVRIYQFTWAGWSDTKGRKGNLFKCNWLGFKPDSIGQYARPDFSWYYCGQ